MHRMCVRASGRRSPREWFPALAVALTLAAPVSADVVLKQKTVSEGLGGFGNSVSEKTLVVSGDKSRSDEVSTYTGRFKGLAGGKPQNTVSITRLDKELIWSLEPEKKQYSELTFEQMRAQYEKGAAEAQKAQAGPSDQDMSFTIDVKKTGAKQTISGFACEQVVITCVGKGTKPVQGQPTEIHMVYDQWLSTKVPGADEMSAFSRRYAEKMGLEIGASNMSPMARQMYGRGFKEMMAKFKDVQGYPVKSVFTVETPATPEQQQAMAQAGQAQAQAAEAMEQAEAERAKAEQAKADQEKAEDVQDAGQLGQDAASGGNVAGKLGGFLGKKLGKSAAKKADKKAEEKSKEMASMGSGTAGGPLLKVVTEVVEITATAAPAGSFDVPAGYKKKS
jgi:hypothetical protein